MTPADAAPAHPNPLDAGHDALARGASAQAREFFGAAVKREPTPEALEGLAMAAWWLDDASSMFDLRERAFRAYRERSDRRGAARIAISLALDYETFRGESAVAKGPRRKGRGSHWALRRRGFHVQANPAGGPFLVPLEISFARQKAVRAARPIYPAGETYHLEGAPDTLLVYSGNFDLAVQLEAAPDAPAGDYFVKGTVHYQGGVTTAPACSLLLCTSSSRSRCLPVFTRENTWRCPLRQGRYQRSLEGSHDNANHTRLENEGNSGPRLQL